MILENFNYDTTVQVLEIIFVAKRTNSSISTGYFIFPHQNTCRDKSVIFDIKEVSNSKDLVF